MKLNIANSRTTWPRALRGKQCILYKEGKLLDVAKKIYNREYKINLCLKIFNVPIECKLEDYYWGSPWRHYSPERTEEIGRRSKLWEATQIQNICAMYNLSPRVYALYTIEENGKRYPVQLIDFLKGETKKNIYGYEKIKELGKEYGFYPPHIDLIADKDWIGNKLIDFQGARFTKDHKEKIKEKIAKFGKYGNYHYQSIPELGLKAHPRDTLKRIEYMKLSSINWKGKTVLDIGCSNGVFLNYAVENGAKYGLGIDWEEPILASKLLSNYLGYFNIDYLGTDIKEIEAMKPYDIVLFLSMNLHVGFPQWVKDSAKELLIFEENAKGSLFKPGYWKNELKKDFKSVEIIGYAADHGNKPIYWCKR